MDNNEVCCCDEVRLDEEQSDPLPNERNNSHPLSQICEPARSHGSFNSTHSDIHDLEVEAGDYITDSLTKAAISEIESFDLSGDSSLFLTVAMAATHNGPFGDPQYKESDIDPSVAAKSKKRAGFSAMAKNLDENVERLHSALATKGILDDTLIVILSDNGGETSAGSSVYPFRGEKFTYFNGGIRPPAAIFGAGVKGGGGEGERGAKRRLERSDSILPTYITNHLPLVASLLALIAAFDDLFWIGDVAPTILEAVGGEIPRGVDGRSHWSAISRPEETSVPFSRSDPFVSGVDPVREAGAVFHGRYKLVVNGTAGYDIDFDKPELGGWVKPGDADGESVEQGVVVSIWGERRTMVASLLLPSFAPPAILRSSSN